jgi:TonB family protein
MEPGPVFIAPEPSTDRSAARSSGLAVWVGVLLPPLAVVAGWWLLRLGPAAPAVSAPASLLTMLGAGALTLAALPVAAACSFFLGFAAAGKRVPSAIPMLLAGFPWLVGVGVSGMAQHQAAVAMRITGVDGVGAMSAGLAEATVPRLMGEIASASLLSAVGLALAVAAVGLRAPGRQAAPGAVIGALAAMPLMGVTVLAAMKVGAGAAAAPLLSAAALVATCALAGAAAGADEPRLRSAAMAAAAPVAGAAGFVAAAQGLRDQTLAAALREAAMTGHWRVESDPGIDATWQLATFGVLFALVPVTTILAWSVARSRPHAPRWIGATALALVTMVIVGPSLLRGEVMPLLQAIRDRAASAPAFGSEERAPVAEETAAAPAQPLPTPERTSPGPPAPKHRFDPHALAAPAREVGRNPAQPLRVGGGVKGPEVLSRVNPSYTLEARIARAEGVVVLEALIDREGNVQDVRVLKGLPHGLDRVAVDAVKQWKFRPATLDGKPVEVYFVVTVNFRLQ